MARSVYSTRLIIANASVSASGSYTVPEGFVAVVRDFEMYCAAGSTAPYAYLEITGAVNAVFAYVKGDSPGTAQWTGRQVLEPGEELLAQGNSESTQTLLVSGYLLTLP